ncbi:unnamed protein product [Linum tenue]|uniref:Uncharacterized protein n=1 Tax=Linum tenue TaxID=586396 RepID=A0AAV0P0A8_9ROSI|nr:unnamed protein product [Linum tenue]
MATSSAAASFSSLLSRSPTSLRRCDTNSSSFSVSFPGSGARLARLSVLLPNPPPLTTTTTPLQSSPFSGRVRTLLESPTPRFRDFAVRSCSNGSPEDGGGGRGKEGEGSGTTGGMIMASSAATIGLAVANRVLYKLALVPMKDYPFFLAQFTTFGYVVIYSSILHVRYRAGIVTDDMLALPKSRYVAIGAFEAVGTLIGMYAAANLPGPSIPLLHQTFLVWQLAFSSIFLGRRYSYGQMAGCLLVALGVVMAVSSGSNEESMLSGSEYMWAGVMILSSALHSGAMILKGKSLDIFVVNTLGSGFQALFVLLFLPLMSNFKGIPLAQLPLYLKSGTGCFLNLWSDSPAKIWEVAKTSVFLYTADCTGAPLLPMLYIAANLTFNMSMLNLMKLSSAVVSSLATTLAGSLSLSTSSGRRFTS